MRTCPSVLGGEQPAAVVGVYDSCENIKHLPKSS